ncbi:MAG: hypothetical protein QNJ78_10705 [Gammaproteobacteria bacterium]|nr:hypothetical protein [Gammaproteobacteria bacterium]
MKQGDSICRLAVALALLTLLTACGRMERLQGANLLQSSSVAFEQAATEQSIRHLRQLGANAIALVAFLQQPAVDSTRMEAAGGMHEPGLRRTIRWAKSHRLRVLLKPQLLVPGSWAGAIAPTDWDAWFTHYTAHLERLAQLAREEGVDSLVIGTELKQSTGQPHWLRLIRRLRKVYDGRLTYAAHGLEGVRQVTFWKQLDSAGVTLYPSLGDDLNRVPQRIAAVKQDLHRLALDLPVPLWVAEVGIASRSQANQRPWAWQDLRPEEQDVDLSLQARVLDLWLESLSVNWLEGVLIWAWYSDPAAGGAQDNGFTPQHKPAERVLSCQWSGRCS